MGKKNDVHVVRRGDEWAVRRENAERDIGKREGLEVVIHRPDGRIRDKDSYGPDPHPPKDRKH